MRSPRRPASASGSRGSGRLVTRQLARATDDGYRNPLVPGLKATADAERLAIAVTQAHERLDPPGPFTAIDETPDVEQATWLAFLFALAPELYDVIDETRPAWEDAANLDALPEAKAKTAAAYRALGRARRLAGGRVHGRGDLDAGAPLRPRLRAARAPRLHPRDALRPADRARRRRHLPARGRRAALRRRTTPTTDAAKRLLVSGDRMLLERRARDLADASGLPIGAFDRGLAVWGTPTEHVDLTAEPNPGIAAALGLR